MALCWWRPRIGRIEGSAQPRSRGLARRPERRFGLNVEELERREVPTGLITPPIMIMPGQFAAPPVGAFTPAQIKQAYGFNQLSFAGHLVADGSGQTIAIIDAGSDPTITTDLATFDAAFNLPAPPSFQIVGQTGGALPTVSAGFEGEIALDVEWSHALAPGANILLVLADDASAANLDTAASFAAAQPGVSVVSMSFGAPEDSSESGEDSTFVTPTGHQGVTFLASTGDTGAPGGYPSFSPNVVAVGGTTLTLDAANNVVSEVGWSLGSDAFDPAGASGGGISQFETQPTYQSSSGLVTQSLTQRTTPDVSFDADPATGVAVADSFDNGAATPWAQIGGTSFSCPAWAAIIAISNQGRVDVGGTTLDGVSQTLPFIYAAPASVFRDIVQGNNGFPAGPGYDLVTGRGSPIVQSLVPFLATSGVPVRVAAGADAGAEPEVRVFDSRTGTLLGEFLAFAPTFTGGVRVAMADVNGDGLPDIICGAGPGGSPSVRIFDGRTFQLIAAFNAFSPTFTGGVNVAGGDVNGDGFADIIVGADAGGGPQVAVFDGRSFARIYNFFAFPVSFTGGVRVASGDVNGDGYADIITAPGAGGLPQVTVYDGKDLHMLESYYALPVNFTGGLYIAAGDLTDSGFADIIVGAGAGGLPQVSVFDGKTAQLVKSYFAYAPQQPKADSQVPLPTAGVRVAFASLLGQYTEIITSLGPENPPQVNVYDGASQQLLESFYAFDPLFLNGVFVGGA